MFNKEEKTGYSQAAFAAVITSGVLGVLPFFNIDINTMQATNLGLFVAAIVGFAWRQAHKRKNKQ